MYVASLGRTNFKRSLARVGAQWKGQSAHCRLRPLVNVRSLSTVEDKKDDKPAPKGLFDKLYGLESNVASKDFTNRWAMVIPAFATHMCIGSPYAWSLMADAITREYGFVAPTSADWALSETAFPISIIFMMMGLSSAAFGKWQVKVGPRAAVATAALAFGGGFGLGAAGIYFHNLPMLYAGYGFLGGAGLGLAYTPPVQTLMEWFPDKKGIASGLTITGFGTGALVFTPAVQYLMKTFSKFPDYLGPASNYVTSIRDGRLYADVDGKLVEVINAGSAELAKLPYDMAEGLYIVGSGTTGAAEALAVMGGAYLTVMLASSLAMKKPHPSYTVPGMPAPTEAGAAAPAAPALDPDLVIKQPQFHLLGTTFFCLAAGGMGMFAVAKPMMSEVFAGALPAVVTSAFASQYLLMLSAGNLGGRIAWAGVSDSIGRRNTFFMFTAGSVPLYLSVPYLVDSVITTGSTTPLYGFCASTALAVTMFGGTYAVLPAYEADLFGAKYVSVNHGRMLVYSAAAALAGPQLLIYLRGVSEKAALNDLLSKVSPDTFQTAFGVGIDKANELIAAKTLTISKLLALCPPGTLDPTPHLYDSTMMAMAGLMGTAVVSHALVRPITQKTMSSGDTIEVPGQPVLNPVVGNDVPKSEPFKQ